MAQAYFYSTLRACRASKRTYPISQGYGVELKSGDFYKISTHRFCTIGIYAKFYTGSEVLDAWHESLDRRLHRLR